MYTLELIVLWRTGDYPALLSQAHNPPHHPLCPPCKLTPSHRIPQASTIPTSKLPTPAASAPTHGHASPVPPHPLAYGRANNLPIHRALGTFN